jgi:hypothetical protein
MSVPVPVSLTIQTRVARAKAALHQYLEVKGEAFEESRAEIVELIADLLHLARSLDLRADIPIEDPLDRARTLFSEQTRHIMAQGLSCDWCAASEGITISPLPSPELIGSRTDPNVAIGRGNWEEIYTATCPECGGSAPVSEFVRLKKPVLLDGGEEVSSNQSDRPGLGGKLLDILDRKGYWRQ